MRPLVVGMDCGGTRSRVVVALAPAAAPRAEVHGGPGNVARQGAPGVAATVLPLLDEALARAGLHGRAPRALVLGAAGAGEPRVRDDLARRLRDALPGCVVLVVTDCELVLHAAFGARPGLAVVAGTGSAVFARDRHGAVLRAGGWGPMVGDQGSGYWLGRHLLSSAARSLDGLEPESETVGRFRRREALGSADELRGWLRERVAHPEAVASLAPVVLEGLLAGDPWALELCRSGARALARLAAGVAGRLGVRGAPKAVLSGGLLEATGPYRDMVVEACAAEASVHVVPLRRRAVEGALAWAVELAREGATER